MSMAFAVWTTSRGASLGRLRWQFFAGHPAAQATGSSRFAVAVGSCATDEDGSCIPPALQVRCRSMTSLNSEFQCSFRHRPGNFLPAQAKRRISTTDPATVHARTACAMMSRYREHSEDQTRSLLNHPIMSQRRLVTCFSSQASLMRQRACLLAHYSLTLTAANDPR